MATWFDGSGWGTREDAIPGEWALLVLCMVALALLGVTVFWFTTLRHERAVRERSRRRPNTTGLELVTDGAAADPEVEPDPDAERDPEAEPAPDPAAFADVPGPEGEAGAEPTPEADADPPDAEPAPVALAESAPEPVSAPKGAGRLTDEMIERVELERTRRKSVKWKELAALVEQEYGVQVHPRTLERALKRRRATPAAGVPAEAASDPASA